MKKRQYSLWLRQTENALALMLSDAAMLLMALLIGNYILYWLYSTPITIRYSIMIIPTWWIGSVVAGVVPGWGLGAVEELRRIELLLICVFTLAAVAYFFSRELMLPSRVVYVGSYLGATVLIPLSRAGCKRILIRLSLWGAPAAIYADARSAERIVAAFGRDNSVGYNPSGIFTDELPAGAQVSGVPVVGGLDDADSDLPVAMVSLANIAEGELTAFLDNQLAEYHKVVLLPNINEDVFSWIIPRNFGGVVGLEVTRNLLLPFVLNIKSIIEIFLVLLTAPVWLPLMLLIALAIAAIDRSLPFYLQVRVGRSGQRFRTIKFRTMRQNADQELEQHMAEDPELRRQWEVGFKLKDDPRVTRLGAFLRKYSLDELPQLFNVLWGDMSLVGPRPLPEYHHEALALSARSPRYRVRPGMTGLWQVSGRSLLAREDMDKWDTYYVRNWSIWLDLVILARTFTAVFSSRGAF